MDLNAILNILKQKVGQAGTDIGNTVSQDYGQLVSAANQGVKDINTALDKTPVLGNIRQFFGQQQQADVLSQYSKQLAMGATEDQARRATQQATKEQQLVNMTMGATGTLENVGKNVAKSVGQAVAPKLEELTTNTIKQLGGRASVSKQFIQDTLKQPQLKQVEKDIIGNILKHEGDVVDVKSFANKVVHELLPLEKKVLDEKTALDEYGARWDSIRLPEEVRGDVANYEEVIYESPVKTTAGEVHFPERTDYYFGHTRRENMADGVTRRIIEDQSDLYQKGGLDTESWKNLNYKGSKFYGIDAEKNSAIAHDKKVKKIAKLYQYTDPTAHYRMAREEVAQAAKDGKTALQFPTGETAMRVEGLAGEEGSISVPYNINAGETFNYADGEMMVVTDYGSSVDAVPYERIENHFDFDQVKSEEADALVDDFLYEADKGDFSRLQNLPDDIKKKWENEVEAGTWDKNKNYDEARRWAEKEIEDRYSDAEDFASQWSEETGRMYFASQDNGIYVLKDGSDSFIETFDKGTPDNVELDVDTDHPIYKFYQNQLGKYLRTKYNAHEIVDENGVSWNQVDIKPEHKGPVEAFGLAPLLFQQQQQDNSGVK